MNESLRITTGQRPARVNLEQKKGKMDQLSFGDLKQALELTLELTRTTFHLENNGFRNAKGEGILIGLKDNGLYEITGLNNNLREIHLFLATHNDSILVKGSTNKEEMMYALKEMIESVGFRIIK
jgi:predicted HTH transcriptional regulator